MLRKLYGIVSDTKYRGRRGREVVGFITTCAIDVYHHKRHGEVYSIQNYVIKFVNDLRQVSVFSLGTPVSSTNKTDRHDIT